MSSGIGVDYMGGPVIDPTENVIALTEAANKRQDDLREMHNRYLGAEIARLAEIVKRVEQVAEVRGAHNREITVIHQTHDTAIHKMEQEKLAAFRASDEAARINEANRNLAALQVVERTLSSTATTLAAKTAADYLESNKRIAALEKSSYEGAGKQAVADPAMEKLVAKLETLITTGAASGGQKEGQKNIVAYISTGIAILLGLLLLADRFGR